MLRCSGAVEDVLKPTCRTISRKTASIRKPLSSRQERGWNKQPEANRKKTNQTKPIQTNPLPLQYLTITLPIKPTPKRPKRPKHSVPKAVVIDVGLAELFPVNEAESFRSADPAGTLATMAPVPLEPVGAWVGGKGFEVC